MKFFASYVDISSPTGYGSLILDDPSLRRPLPSVLRIRATTLINSTLRATNAELHFCQPVVPHEAAALVFVQNKWGTIFDVKFAVTDPEGEISFHREDVFDKIMLDSSTRLRIWEELIIQRLAKKNRKVIYATVIEITPMLRAFYE